MRDLPKRGEPGWTGPAPLVPLIDEIMARFPAAREFEPCDCGLTVAVVARKLVQPGLHFVVDATDLRDRAVELIREHHLLNNVTEDPDAVLILAERA